MTVKIEKIANMIFITEISSNVIFKAWDITDFTERKLQNAINKISKNLNGNLKVINTL